MGSTLMASVQQEFPNGNLFYWEDPHGLHEHVLRCSNFLVIPITYLSFEA